MKLILKNHTEEYAAREIITSYLPKTKIEIADDSDLGEDYVISSFSENNGEYVYDTLLFLDGKKYHSSITEKEYNKTYVKKSIDIALKDALGIDLPWGLITGIRPSKLVRELSESGFNKDEIKERFKTFYKCTSDKTDLATEIAYREKNLIDSMPKDSVSLYVGIPFCPTRCLYCSFTSQSVKFSNTLTEPYLDALQKEIIYTAKLIKNNNLKVDTVYIGGGTPTALSANQLERLLTDIFKNFDLSSIREFTLEAGRPDTIDEEKLRIIRDFEIGRISINPQTMNQKTLDIIGRKHTPEDIIRTYDMAVKCGFKHINTDLIAGLPGENEADFIHTLDEIRKLNPQSVTVHTMSIKRGSFLDRDYSMYTPSAAKTVNNMLSDANRYMTRMNKVPYYMYRQKNMLGNLENVGYCDEGHECLYPLTSTR